MLLNPDRRHERDALLQSISSLLSREDRVVAAWLFGSLGRGTADDFSDIDIWIVVEDDQIDAVAAARQAFAAQIETPILVIEAPQNAPPGGGYLLTLFTRPSGLQQVDWYWQARSRAAVPANARMLFEREPIPRAMPVVPRTELNLSLDGNQLEYVAKKIEFLWAMLPIAAKKMARGQSWEAFGMIIMLRNIIAELSDLLAAQQSCAAALALPPTHEASEWHELIMALAKAMEHLMSAAEKQGATIPRHVVPQVYTTIDLLLNKS